VASALQLEASVARSFEGPRVRGAVEILRNFFASLAASFSGMCSSLPALGHIIGATLGGFQLAFEQIKALVAQLDAPPMLSSLLVNLLSTCCAATAIFAAGVAVFVLCLALSGLSFVASISLTLTSGILFSFSTFLAFAGGMLVIPAMVISGIGSVALAAAAVPYRITNAKKAAESDEDHDALTTEDLKDEGFVSVSSPSDKKSINGGFFGSLWKRKAGPIDSSLQPEAQQALREGRAVLS